MLPLLSAVSTSMSVLVSPLFTAVQLAPPSVLLNTPPAAVPANTRLEFVGSTTSERKLLAVIPLLIVVQLPPPFVLFDTPLNVPAYRTLWFDGSIVNAKTLAVARL